MILNHAFQFIFLKTKKTAGTSVEIALSRYCSPGDIVTRLGARDEPKRTALGYQGPTNYLVPRAQWTHGDRLRHLCYTPHRWRRTLLGKEINMRKEVSYYNHMPALELRGRLPADTWNGYFKFCVERNPWDRAVSAYFWENRNAKHLPDFMAFLRRLQRTDLLSNYSTYAIDGRIAVDRVLRYEALQAGLEQVGRDLGLPGPLDVPRTKQEFRTDRRPYAEFYTAESRDFVAAACAAEIEAFGYRFESGLAGGN
ncbi:MAG: sulfotransferase family 2 domain-containing protein [Steroidobacteraceae bacterium]